MWSKLNRILNDFETPCFEPSVRNKECLNVKDDREYADNKYSSEEIVRHKKRCQAFMVTPQPLVWCLVAVQDDLWWFVCGDKNVNF